MAAWLQGIGTVTALVTAVIGGIVAWKRYRLDGFVPRLTASRDRDGWRAAVVVENRGRSVGKLDAVFVEEDGDFLQPQPALFANGEPLSLPADLRPDHALRLLFDATATHQRVDDGPFRSRAIGVTAQFGARECSVRPRPLRGGFHLDQEDYPHRATQHLPVTMLFGDSPEHDGSEPRDTQTSGRWRRVGTLLDEIAARRLAGELSTRSAALQGLAAVLHAWGGGHRLR